MSAEDKRHEGGSTPVVRFWLPLLLLAVPLLSMLGGCSSGSTAPVAETPGPAVTGTDAPTMAELEQVLQAELARLGKSTMAVGEYSAPTGDDNIPFDLHAQVIDPDGEGGADPLGVHVSWTERLIGDYNMDGLVNASDLTPIGQYYGQTIEYRDPADVGGVEWWPEGLATDVLNPENMSPWRLARIDGNGDGLINMQDITPIGQHWQERITHYGFLITRPGTFIQPVMDPDNPTQGYHVEFNNTPLKQIHGEDWPDVPVLYEVDLPAEVLPADLEMLPGDIILIAPLCGEDEALHYSVTCTTANPRWQAGVPISWTAEGLLDAFAVRTFTAEEPTGLVVCAEEYLRGDLDGNGISHSIETSLLYKYIGADAASYPEPARSIIERLDWNRNGFPEVGDITPVGHTIYRRLVGLAFAFKEGTHDDTLVMNESNPALRHIVPRRMDFHPNQHYVYHGWVPDMESENELGICLVTANTPAHEINDPTYYPMLTGVASSEPGDDEAVTAVITYYGGLIGRASFSQSGEIVEYAWDVDGAGTFSETDETFFIDGLAPGEHTITLRVTDSNGNSAEVTETVTVPE